MEAHEDLKDTALFAITSSDRLYNDWQDKGRDAHIHVLLACVPRGAKLVTVLDGHPASLAWLGSVHGHYVKPLGVNAFGQTGSVQQLYETYGIDTKSIIAACS